MAAPPQTSLRAMSGRKLEAGNLRVISSEIADQEICMDRFIDNEFKSRRIGAFRTQEANALDVADSRFIGSGDYEIGSISRRLQSVTRPGGTLQGIL